MRTEKLRSGLITAGVAFCMSFGAVACVTTGLSLPVDLLGLAAGCLLFALVAAAAYSIPKGGRVAVSLGALGLVLLLAEGSLLGQLLDIARVAATLYSRAYGFPIPEILRQASAESHLLALLTVAALIQLVTAWIMLHHYPSSLAVFTAVLPLVSCFVVTDTVPQVWCLAIWLFGIAMLVMTQSVRIRSDHSADRLTGILALPLILGLTLLMMIVPEEGFVPPVSQERFQSALDWVIGKMPFLGRTSDGQLVISFSSDLEDEVDLAQLDDRQVGDSLVLEVTPDWSGKIYLRIRNQDIYTGTGWEVSEGRETFSPPPEYLSGEKQYLQIRVLGNRNQMLVPYYPDSGVTLDGGVAEVDRRDREYDFDVVLLKENWADQWRADSYWSSEPVDECYLALPQDTYEEACQILEEIQGLQGRDTVAAAEIIGSYVSKTAKYSTKVDRMPTDRDDFAIWFLEEADRGYCVHFATAATVLLRANGIPARYVEGYAFRAKAWEVNQVRQDMAHAWVEYYVDGVGWVVLDPTPGMGQSVTVEPTTPSTEPIATDGTAPPTTETTRPKPTAPVKPTTSTPEGTGPDLPDNPSNTGVDASTGGQPEVAEDWTMPQWLRNAVLGLAAVAAGAAVILGQWIGRRWWKLRQMRRGRPEDRVIARYREGKRICRAVKAEVPEVLETLAQKAGFSPHPLSREELAAANTAFADCFALLEKGRWYQKLFWRFVLALY